MKEINTPTIPITSALKLTQLKELVKKYKINGVSKLSKEQLVTRLRNEFKGPLSRANLENIHFMSASPPKKNQINVKTMAIRKLRRYAGDRCMKGRSKYPRVSNLRKFVLDYQQPVKSPLNRSKITTLTAQPLRRYASEHCVRGYTKYPKKTNLQKFLLTKL